MVGRLPIRFLGSKARLTGRIVERIAPAVRGRTVVDLFAGVGHVSAGFASHSSVAAIDISRFAEVVLRWRLTSQPTAVHQLPVVLAPDFIAHRRALVDEYNDALRAERRYIDRPSPSRVAEIEKALGGIPGPSRERVPYSLLTAYFANSYFGVQQAIDLDALRFASFAASSRGAESQASLDAALVAILCAATHLAHTPGHFAQYFRVSPANAGASAALRSRSVWFQWSKELARLQPAGDAPWRSRNQVKRADSLTLAESPTDALTFADPPYTDSQYSRFYHVLDTVAAYDYPECLHGGRYRSDRYTSPFCRKRTVRAAFQRLMETALTIGDALYLTYPTNGLLLATGVSVHDVATEVGARAHVVDTLEVLHAAPGRSQRARRTVSEELWRIYA